MLLSVLYRSLRSHSLGVQTIGLAEGVSLSVSFRPTVATGVPGFWATVYQGTHFLIAKALRRPGDGT